MLKRFLSLSLALVMALGLFAGAVDYKDADDISSYAKDAVQVAYDLNLMQGDDKGSFNPKDTITREQMMRVMYALHEAGSTDVDPLYAAVLGSYFNDAAAVTSWARGFAGYSFSQGIFEGDGANNLRPKAAVSYAEVSILLLRALGYSTDYIQYRNTIWKWYDNAILLAQTVGITKGLPAIANSKAAATREDVAVMIVNALGVATVTYNKDTDKYVAGDVLLEANYGVEPDEDGKYEYVVEGIVKAAAADGKSYTLLDGTTTYTLDTSEETFDASLVGKTVRWSYRDNKITDRINNLIAVDEAKLYEGVRLDEIKFNSDDELVIDGAKTGVKIDDEVTVYFAGNGVLALQEYEAVDRLFGKLPFADAKTVDVAITGDTIVVRGWLSDSYVADTGLNLPTSGVAVVDKVDGNYVVLDVKSWTRGVSGKLVYVIDELDGAVKGDVVLFDVDYANALLGKNDDAKKAAEKLNSEFYSGNNLLANVSLEVLDPVAVKSDKIVKRSDGTYRMDGKTVAASDLAAVGFDIEDYVAQDKDSTGIVYMSDKYLYLGDFPDGGGDKETTTYLYGLFVDQYYIASGDNAGGYVKVLGTDGEEHVLKVAKVGNEDGSKFVDATRTDDPVGYDAVGAPVFGIAEITADKKTPVSFIRNDNGTYNLVVGKLVPSDEKDSSGNPIYLDGDRDAATLAYSKVASQRAITVGTGEEKTTLAYYNLNTVFFVIYDTDKKVMVIKGSDVVADQAGMKIHYVYNDSTILDTVTHAVVEVDTLTMTKPATTTTKPSILLTKDPTWTTYSDRIEVLLTGIVDGALVTDVAYTAASDITGLSGLKAGKRVELTLKDGKLTAVTELGYDVSSTLVAYEEGILQVVADEGTENYDVNADTEVYVFTKDGYDADATPKAGWFVYLNKKAASGDDATIATYVVISEEAIAFPHA